MKTTLIALFILSFYLPAAGQELWTPPVRLTTGSSNDGSPVFETRSFEASNEEWLAFVRNFPEAGVSGISVLKMTDSTGSPMDSVIAIFEDSAGNDDQPAMASTQIRTAPADKMLLWHRDDGRDNIWYSRDSAGVWSMPRPLTDDSL